MAERAAGELRYKAFLSYSHKDSAAAARLHRRLESYRLPRRLVGREAGGGPVPQRLSPIFRDREELPAVADLSETVRSALAQSGALIVLCSPHGAASLWVAEEIRTFRALHPDRPVLAALIAGEPSDCFPDSLWRTAADGSRHEPLAADFRPGADGERLGLLKLVAGLTGVGLDDLVQRDASRRIRRVTAVTAMALAAMLIMAALTVFALGARTEAERQRAEAEGLIEFMLTGLREQLRGVGRLDVLTAVNQRALGYYADQGDLSRLPADSLERRARALHAIGEDDLALGDEAAALAAFREAHRTTASLLQRSPDDAERIFTHAQSDYWIGRIHELRRSWRGAERQYRLYAAAGEQLIAIAPRRPDYMMEAGWGAQNLGAVRLHGFDDVAAARRYFETAIRWFQRAAAMRPADSQPLREQANVFGWLADSFYARQEWPESLAARRRQYELTERLYLKEPSNLDLLYRLAIAERSVALLSARAGERGQVRPLMLRAYERTRSLTQHDPRNSEWLLLRAKVECDMLSPRLAIEPPVALGTIRRSVTQAAAALTAQNNLTVSELSSCIERIASTH
jgi:hypothetical protein